MFVTVASANEDNDNYSTVGDGSGGGGGETAAWRRQFHFVGNGKIYEIPWNPHLARGLSTFIKFHINAINNTILAYDQK